MNQNAQQLRARIALALSPESVVTEHNERGHFYRIMTPDEHNVVGNVYPSVTGKLQIIKDESLINYKMNQAIQYVFRKYKDFNDSNIMEHLDLAARASADVLSDAGDIGTDIHEIRETIFRDVIAGKNQFEGMDWLSYVSPEKTDVRITSAIRALSAFVRDHEYIPIATELFVYSHKLKVAGTLDDIGLMKRVLREGNSECDHSILAKGNDFLCVKCGFKYKFELVLMDVKTSNQFKDHYFFQVALYYEMFKHLTDLRPERCFILKLSKIDGTYKIEDLKQPSMLASYARSMVRTHNGIMYIRGLRKDNQKLVGDKIEL